MNRYSFGFSAVLNLLMPGLGHAFWREYAFGAFVFLVMVLSTLLFAVSVVLSLGTWVRFAIWTVPLIFYLFTFVDLRRVVRGRAEMTRRKNVTVLVLCAGIGWQLFSPMAPGNLAFRNFPEVFRQKDNSMSPVFREGQYLFANSLAYRASIAYLGRPQMYALPEVGDMVRFVESSNTRRVGLVIGISGDQVEVDDGLLTVGASTFLLSDMLGVNLSGSVELTTVGPGSIMVLTMRLGAIDRVEQVPITEVIGKVHTLF